MHARVSVHHIDECPSLHLQDQKETNTKFISNLSKRFCMHRGCPSRSLQTRPGSREREDCLDQGGEQFATERWRGEEGYRSKSVNSRVGVIVLYFFSRGSPSVPSFIIRLWCECRKGETRVRARYPLLHPRICGLTSWGSTSRSADRIPI